MDVGVREEVKDDYWSTDFKTATNVHLVIVTVGPFFFPRKKTIKSEKKPSEKKSQKREKKAEIEKKNHFIR